MLFIKVLEEFENKFPVIFTSTGPGAWASQVKRAALEYFIHCYCISTNHFHYTTSSIIH